MSSLKIPQDSHFKNKVKQSLIIGVGDQPCCCQGGQSQFQKSKLCAFPKIGCGETALYFKNKRHLK